MRHALTGLALLVACGGGSDPYDVTIDTLNVGLAGAFVPNEAARRTPVVEAIAAMDSDIVCLQEVWIASDKTLIADGVRAAFPHSASFEHDLSTPVDDATDQMGMVPPPDTEAPCADSRLAMTLEAALTCLRENCSTVPDSDDGHTTSAACAEAMCVESVAALLLGDDAALACYSCLTTALPTDSFGDLRNLCTTQVGAELAFQGQSGVMILSKHPISNAEAFVMPGTWNRRIVAEATVTLPNDTEVDVYCNHLTPIFDSLAFPYTGDYGADLLGADGWAAEQLLQAQKLIARVAARSGTETPAFILGDMNTGRPYMDVLEGEGVPTLDALEAAFTLAVTPDYVPACTHCPDNANVSDASVPVWIDHILMTNVPAENVLSTLLTYDEPTVDAGGTMVPISDHYGRRSVVTID